MVYILCSYTLRVAYYLTLRPISFLHISRHVGVNLTFTASLYARELHRSQCRLNRVHDLMLHESDLCTLRTHSRLLQQRQSHKRTAQKRAANKEQCGKANSNSNDNDDRRCTLCAGSIFRFRGISCSLFARSRCSGSGGRRAAAAHATVRRHCARQCCYNLEAGSRARCAALLDDAARWRCSRHHRGSDTRLETVHASAAGSPGGNHTVCAWRYGRRMREPCALRCRPCGRRDTRCGREYRSSARCSTRARPRHLPAAATCAHDVASPEYAHRCSERSRGRRAVSARLPTERERLSESDVVSITTRKSENAEASVARCSCAEK